MRKKLLALFGKKVRLINMRAETERRILLEMSRIDGINDYFALQKQAGYQLYARTDEKKFLGYSDLAETFITNMYNATNAEKEDDVEDEDTTDY